jgi:hypothetical protein
VRRTQQSAGGIEALGTDSPPTLPRVGKIMLLWAVKRSSASAEIGARVAHSPFHLIRNQMNIDGGTGLGWIIVQANRSATLWFAPPGV